MNHRTPGQLKSFDELATQLALIDPTFVADEVLEGADGPLGSPLEVPGLHLDNRFCIHPMEGWDGTADGGPGPLTLRRWERFGRSGAGLIWGGEAFAVQADGRANARQLCVTGRRDHEADLVQLREALRAGRRAVGLDPDGAVVGLQLTHSGRFARTETAAAPRLVSRHPLLDTRVGADPDSDLLTDGELEGIAERYVRLALLARDAGFDFVDVKACHGYLLHELLGARTRPGSYGGDFAGRSRLLLGIVDELRAVAPDLTVGVRLSVRDLPPYAADPQTGLGVPPDLSPHLPWQHGFGVDPLDPSQPDLAEPLELCDALGARGVTLINATAGSPYYCPHLQRPAAWPPSDGYEAPADPLESVFAHLELVRTLKGARPALTVVGSGYSYLMEWLPHVAQAELRAGHVDLVGLGRMVLSYPELPLDVLAGRALDRKRICRTFSDCTSGPRRGLVSGCYPLDSEYRSKPVAAELRDARARR